MQYVHYGLKEKKLNNVAEVEIALVRAGLISSPHVKRSIILTPLAIHDSAV